MRQTHTARPELIRQNGFRIVTEHMLGFASPSIGFWSSKRVRGMKRPRKNGIAHFLEHMAFKGRAKRTYVQIRPEWPNSKDKGASYIRTSPIKADRRLGIELERRITCCVLWRSETVLAFSWSLDCRQRFDRLRNPVLDKDTRMIEVPSAGARRILRQESIGPTRAKAIGKHAECAP